MLRRSADSLGWMPTDAEHGTGQSRLVTVLSAVAGWTVAFLILAGWLLLLQGAGARLDTPAPAAVSEAGHSAPPAPPPPPTNPVHATEEVPPQLRLDENLAKALTAPPPARPRTEPIEDRSVVAALYLTAVASNPGQGPAVPRLLPPLGRETPLGPESAGRPIPRTPQTPNGSARAVELPAKPPTLPPPVAKKGDAASGSSRPPLPLPVAKTANDNFDPIICRVGQPVLIVAQLADSGGAPVVGRRVDWSIDRHGVGTIVQAAPAPPASSTLPEVSPLFAQSFTIGGKQADDTVLPTAHEGQPTAGSTWCLVSAESPGEMLVTASTPDGQGGVRQATERLHWSAAKAEFLRSQSIPAGSELVLETRVADERTGAPLEGYRVRYQWSQAGPLANSLAVEPREITTGVDGIARLRVRPGRLVGASPQLRTELFPPRSPSAPAAVRLAESTAVIEWQAPKLAVAVEGPTIVAVGEWCAVRARATAARIAEGTELRLVPQPTADLECGSAGPPAPSAAGTIEQSFRLRAARAGKMTLVVELRHGDEVCAAGSYTFEAGEPVLTVEKSLPKDWWAGRAAVCGLRVTNRGSVPGRQVRLIEEIPPGLEVDEATGNLGSFQLRFDLGDVAPGESKTVEYRATAPGPIRRRTVLTQVSGSNFTTVEQVAALEVRGAAVLAAAVTDQHDPVEVGSTVAFAVQVSNRGTAPAETVRIELASGPGLELLEVFDQARRSPAERSVWSAVVGLEPGARVHYQVRARAIHPGASRLSVRLHHASLGPDGLVVQESTTVYEP